MGKQRSCFHIFLAFILKFLNYLQTFIGVSMIVYSCFMLNQWRHHCLVPSSASSAPSPFDFSNPESVILLPHDVTPLSLHHLDFAADVVELDRTRHDGLQVNSHHLPTPWFIYAFMGVGIALCLITCAGHIAAEAMNGCCLCFNNRFSAIIDVEQKFDTSLWQFGLVAFIALDHQWEKDLPTDSTGELDRLRAFIEEHMDVCKWVAIAVIIIQVLTLLLSIILRALVNQKVDLDESVHDISGRPWEALLHPHLNQASGSVRSDIRGDSDIWSARIREKYGLDGSSGKEDQNVQVDRNSKH